MNLAESMVEELKQYIRAIDTKLDVMNSSLNALQNQLTEQSAKRENMEQMVKKHENSIGTMTERVHGIDVRLVAFEQLEAFQMVERIRHLEKTNDKLTGQLEAAREKTGKFQEEISELKQDLGTIRSSMDRADGKKEGLSFVAKILIGLGSGGGALAIAKAIVDIFG